MFEGFHVRILFFRVQVALGDILVELPLQDVERYKTASQRPEGRRNVKLALARLVIGLVLALVPAQGMTARATLLSASLRLLIDWWVVLTTTTCMLGKRVFVRWPLCGTSCAQDLVLSAFPSVP